MSKGYQRTDQTKQNLCKSSEKQLKSFEKSEEKKLAVRITFTVSYHPVSGFIQALKAQWSSQQDKNKTQCIKKYINGCFKDNKSTN